jgi:hypothetical protein
MAASKMKFLTSKNLSLASIKLFFLNNGKFVPVLDKASRHERWITSQALNLGTAWRSGQFHTPIILFQGGNSLRYP